MTVRTLTLRATNATGFVESSADVTIADPAPIGNTMELVGTNMMKDLNPDPARTALYSGHMGQEGIFSAGGVCFSPQCGPLGSIVTTGGGHGDYAGNEVYIFDLATLTWRRLTNPSAEVKVSIYEFATKGDIPCDQYGLMPDGTPVAGHTHNVQVGIAGGNSGLLLLYQLQAMSWNGSRAGPYALACDLETGTWSVYSTNAGPVRYDALGADVTCYDARRNRVWGMVRGGGAIVSYLDLATKTFTRLPVTMTNTGYNPSACAVPYQDLMLVAGGVYVGSSANTGPMIICALDLANPQSGQHNLTLTGDPLPLTGDTAASFDLDSDTGNAYLYFGNWPLGDTYGHSDTGHVYRLTPPATAPLVNPWTVTKIALPQPFPSQRCDGPYSRFRYCPSIKKFAYVAGPSTKVALWTPPA